MWELAHRPVASLRHQGSQDLYSSADEAWGSGYAIVAWGDAEVDKGPGKAFIHGHVHDCQRPPRRTPRHAL